FIETDCPFLTPVPFRGRRNEPALVIEVARFLAEIRDLTTEEMGCLTANNFARFFGLTLPCFDQVGKESDSPAV
ncbi:MAG: TatD family hydrolase, partial [Acidobacteria bacterium]|nr:TatD family hydrolase [Acidobacteriota bacterium]